MKQLLILPFLFMVQLSFSQPASDTAAIKLPACPVCKKTEKVIPILYGKPGKEAIEKAARGECYLGGCVISKDSPRYYCRRDDKEF
ncbi:MAG: hypothetical protein H7Y01_03830 [Ferruginibacter sp.]|nr:hypothetical protein [Chitinophagaceae bacterium]